MRATRLFRLLAVFCVSAFCLLLPSAREYAQAVPGRPASLLKAADRFASESIVIEHSSLLFSMNADGTGFKEQSLSVRVQSEAAVREVGVLTLGFAGASERVELEYARVRQPDGTVIETPVSGALEQPQPVTREAPFYSDLKQMQLPIKGLAAGDLLEWKVRIVRTKAEAPGQFWGDSTFADSVVSLADVLELRVPRSSEVNVWTNPKLSVKPVETTDGETRVYRWTTANLKATTGPEADAEKKRKETEVWTPDQELDAKQGKLPSVAWSTFRSWEEVGSWYRGLEGDRPVPDDSVKAKVADLTRGKATLEDKVRAVYGYVGPQVRYIGVAFGVGRYQPHSAEEVLQNEYGDCKDKHTLLSAMLRALGLHPDAVLIGAGVHFNEAVPSPSAFNHLITRVDVNGTETWLDSTAEVAPYRMLTLTIRDKEALVIPETGAAKIMRTPASPPTPVFQTMKVEGVLTSDGTETEHVTLAMSGDSELFLREVLHQVAPAQYESFAQKLWASMGFDGTTSQAQFARPEDTDAPLKIGFVDKREKAGGDWEHDRIVAQLSPAGLPEVDEKKPPVQAIQLGTPQTVTSIYRMKLPQGWGAELPEAVHDHTSFATYDLTFHLDEGTVSAERKLVILEEKVPATEWRAYKKFVETTAANTSPYIQLTRNELKGGPKQTSADAVRSGPASAAENADAAKLIAHAFEAMRSMHVDEAAPLLAKAKSLNDQQKGLWAGYGYMASLRGAPIEAVEDYRKELSLNPRAFFVYQSITYCQLQSGKRSDAMETLQEWAAADPSDATPSIQLSGMQLADGQAAAAYATMTAAISKLPEDKRNQDSVVLALTAAEMKNGMVTKASDALVALLKTTDDALILNDAAYALSEANRELPAAEAGERKALAMMDAETESWTLEESPALLKQKTSLLAASWDTMGWILFREGKLEESLSYIEAAWHNRGDAVVAEHLGDIEMALHKPDRALMDYELAKKSGGPVAALDAKQAAARKAGGATYRADDAQEQLLKARTINLGAALGKQGAAEYRMLLSHGRVERVDATTEKNIPGGPEMIRKMDADRMFPSGSAAKLAKLGILNCHAGACELVFEP